ncbi:MAG: FAD binding domain-containing protein [Eubacteriales bacterium]|nr:FAD binding domain-containing protein [Eubacteriales bacterium]
MAFPRFKFTNAKSIDQAACILKNSNGRTAVIAGGTDLLHGYKDHIYSEYPELVVNLRSVTDGDYIKSNKDGVAIGALTTLHDIEQHQLLKEQYSVLAQAASTVASPQIRNNGTIGGNICQEPRCWYYRNADNQFHCLRKGGNFCNALTGHNEIHSIFGSMPVEITPCKTACPAGNAIPEYLSKIREDNMPEAAKILLQTNPLAAITGRVCPHTCEGECNRGRLDEEVGIRSIERSVGDFILKHFSELLPKTETSTGKKIAVIGSGPAGLAAAFYLKKQGHTVRVFDKMPKAGGMLRYGIPEYRLPYEVLDAQIKGIESMGVEFVLGTEIGTQKKLAEIRKEYAAVFLATGAWTAASIHLDGEDKTVPAMQFLQDVASGKKVKPGDQVVVIGGGNVAVDAAMTAHRLGAKQVTIVYRRTREEMPAIKDDVEQALAENIELKTSWAPNRVIVSKGKVAGLEVVKSATVYNEGSGRFEPKSDPSDKDIIAADCIILAVGQQIDLSYIEKELGISGKAIEVHPETKQTSVTGLYAGGDAVTGPATVIEAAAAGRKAAEAINRFVNGTGKKEVESNAQTCSLSGFDPSCLKPSKRIEMPELPVEERTMEKEDTLGLSPEQVKKEAKRCFHCGCVASCPSDTAPALVALGAKIKTTKRVIDAEEFFAVKVLKSTVLEPDELVTEIQLPAANAGMKSTYLKFRHRQAIDFPLASVAIAVTSENGKVAAARITLGAAAPVPIRAKEAEEYLKGKAISEEVAAAAARLAISGVLPLDKNYYKIQVTKALVRRAILACS